MDVFEALQNTTKFERGIDGLLFKKVSGYLYTIAVNQPYITVCVNLPPLSRYQRKEIEYYIKSNAQYFVKLKFLTAGVKIFFVSELLEEPSYIMEFISRFSDFLKYVNILFTRDINEFIVNKDHMYILPPTEKAIYADNISQHSVEEILQDVSVAQEKTNLSDKDVPASFEEEYSSELLEKKPKKISLFLQRFSPTLLMFLAMLIFSLLFGLLCVFLPQVAAAAGYLIGSIGTYLYLKATQSRDKLFLKASLISLALLIFFGSAAFLYLFLSQLEFYTIFEYVEKTLTLQYCIFNIVLGYLLALFGIYSTLPAKAKKKANKGMTSQDVSVTEPDDFNS